jgi:hypothetical protein
MARALTDGYGMPEQCALVWSGGQAWEEADGHGYPGVARCQGLPNQGMQATGNSLRSCLAPALSRA